jgi:L-cysteine desulfidase
VEAVEVERDTQEKEVMVQVPQRTSLVVVEEVQEKPPQEVTLLALPQELVVQGEEEMVVRVVLGMGQMELPQPIVSSVEVVAVEERMVLEVERVAHQERVQEVEKPQEQETVAVEKSVSPTLIAKLTQREEQKRLLVSIVPTHSRLLGRSR